MLLEPHMVLPMVKGEGIVELMEVIGSLENKRDGVVCHFMAPLLPAPGSPLQPFVLNFRGTQPNTDKKQSGVSVHRDLDPSGVGRATFEAREQEILDQVTAFLREARGPVHLQINGHSLGGADVQRALALIAREMAKEDHDPCFDKIQKLTATAHNPPGVEKDVNDQFFRDLNKLTIPVELNYVLCATDPVPVAGGIFLGAVAKKESWPDHFSPTMVLLASEQVKYLEAHGARGFAVNKDLFSRQRLTKGENEELLKHMLGKWDLWDSFFGYAAYRASMPAVYLIQSVAYMTLGLAIRTARFVRHKGSVPKATLI
jgi:hypothetical protein